MSGPAELAIRNIPRIIARKCIIGINGVAPNLATLLRRERAERLKRGRVRKMPEDRVVPRDPRKRGAGDMLGNDLLAQKAKPHLAVEFLKIAMLVQMLDGAPHLVHLAMRSWWRGPIKSSVRLLNCFSALPGSAMMSPSMHRQY
jgi:hypothetical protein